MGKFFTGLFRFLDIVTGFFRVLFEKAFGITAHKWEVQCPPCLTHNRNVSQLFFNKEFKKGYFFDVKLIQHKNIDPALVIRRNQIPSLGIQSVKPFDVPIRLIDPIDPPKYASIHMLAMNTMKGFTNRLSLGLGMRILMRMKVNRNTPNKRV